MGMKFNKKRFYIWPGFLFVLIFLASLSCSKEKHNKISSKQGLERLMQGNERYVNNQMLHLGQNFARREAIASGQSPFAIILSCSDSRVSPEIVFDEGLGDLFVIRVAGNVIGPIEMESLEYAVHHLHSPLILVLSHENCGAVEAVVENKAGGIEEIAKILAPAVQTAKESDGKNLIDEAAKRNAINMKDFLKQSPSIGRVMKEGKIQIFAAFYNLKTGVVELLK